MYRDFRARPSTALGQALSELREGRDISQVELGRCAAVARPVVSRIEAGKAGASLTEPAKMAAALELTAAERVRLIEAGGFPLGGSLGSG